MIHTIAVPLLAMGMNEGKVVEWYVADGETATEGKPLYSIEFEKSVVDVDAPATGVLKQMAEVGAVLEVGALLAEIHA